MILGGFALPVSSGGGEGSAQGGVGWGVGEGRVVVGVWSRGVGVCGETSNLSMIHR
jgi:hypothetical protein